MLLAYQADWGVMKDRLPELDDVRLQRWLNLVESRTGIVIPPERKAFLEAGLRARMQQLGIADYDQYFRCARAARSGSEEWSHLVDRLTVHETSFFRHAPSLRLVENEVLPAYSARKGDRGGFHAWSLGCATGEEPYSLAMLIHQHFAGVDAVQRFGITATDISRPALQTARTGVYSERRLRDLPAALRERFCVRLGDGRIQMSDELRRRICFAQLDVLRMERFPLRGVDLIYCQNMLMYFPRVRRLQIVEKLAGRVAPGGVLVLGPGDLPCWAHKDFTRMRYEGTLAFQRHGADTASV